VIIEFTQGKETLAITLLYFASAEHNGDYDKRNAMMPDCYSEDIAKNQLLMEQIVCLCFNCNIAGKPALASSPFVSLPHLFWNSIFGNKQQKFSYGSDTLPDMQATMTKHSEQTQSTDHQTVAWPYHFFTQQQISNGRDSP